MGPLAELKYGYRVTEMPDKENPQQDQNEERQPQEPTKPARDVVVRYLDNPPPSGKERIHPRRPAPIVPTREQRTGVQETDDQEPEKSSRE